MLEKLDLQRLLEKLGTPVKGQKLVLNARSQAPVRKVESRGGNVVTVFSSRKMGREIRTESRNFEFAAVVNFEFDDSVRAYYPQPCELRLELIDPATGEIHNVHHFPDLLRITDTGISLIECKSEAKLARLAAKYPWRYQRDSQGQFYAPLIEAKLSEWGIGYEILSEQSLPPLRVENLLHLSDYLLPAAEPCPQDVLDEVHGILREHGHVYIAELTSSGHGIAVDYINKAIADQLLVTNYDTERLTEPARSRIFRDAILMDFVLADEVAKRVHENFTVEIAPGAEFHFGSQVLKIQLVDDRNIVCTDDQGGTRTVEIQWLLRAIESKQVWMEPPKILPEWSRYSEKELRAANFRLQQMHSEKPQLSERTLSRYRSKCSLAEKNGGAAVLALVPQTAMRGNRTQRLEQAQLDVLRHVFEQSWSSHEARSYKACHNILRILCAVSGVKLVSQTTMIQYIDKWCTTHDERARNGKRLAYQKGQFVEVLSVDSPPHGSRWFQYVHIDHTKLDIELISGVTGKKLGRPWLTLAVDAFTRKIVAMYLTFDPPSYVSAMMVVRDMVRRHQRLPEFVVVDNGKDLISSAFAVFLESMGVHLRIRPAGQPRHGTVMERLFGSLTSGYIHNLAGNTKATKNVRMTTGKHLPKNFAEWTLEHMYAGLEYWAFVYYEEKDHPTIGMSPGDAVERSLKTSGSRPHKWVPFTQDFLIATCPPVSREGTRVVDGQRGVKVHDRYYWDPIFASPKFARKSLEVREDPWDSSSVYVRVGAQWVRARCKALLHMGQLTEFERKALSKEYAFSTNGKDISDASQQRLAEFLRTFTPQGALAVALECEQENKYLYGRIGIANVSPIEVSPKGRLSQILNGEVITNSKPHLDHQFPTGPGDSLPRESAKPMGTNSFDGELIDFDEF